MATHFAEMAHLLANMRPLFGVAALAVFTSLRAAAQTPSDSLCIFSGPQRSTLAWESAARSFAGGGVFGHILRLRDRSPITTAFITLEPGAFQAYADNAGSFEIHGAPNGRYLLRIQATGAVTVADSITLGADGLVVLAVVAYPPGDIGITCPVRSAPVRRPPNGR